MKTITVHHSAHCLTCDEPIEAGEKANWEPNVGIWHTDCKTPRNLGVSLRAADKRRELGIDPPAFGSAPMLRDRDDGENEEDIFGSGPGEIFGDRE